MADVLRVHADGPEAVEETWQKFVPSARLNRVDPSTFSFSWVSAEMPGFSLVTYDLNAQVQSETTPTDQLLACRVDSTAVRLRSVRSDLDASAPWLATDNRVAARWSGASQVRAFVFDLPTATNTAQRISGDDRLVLRVMDATARSRAWGVQWEQTFRHVRGALATAAAEGVEARILETELHRMALTTTLMAFSTTFLEGAERTAQTRAAPASVRRGIAYIEAHAHEPITVEEIAAAAGMSTRGLQMAFRRAVGKTPMAYLRAVRLTHAHDELRHDADATVRTVAMRWGFADPSRFARYYREFYGRNPAHTLRDR